MSRKAIKGLSVLLTTIITLMIFTGCKNNKKNDDNSDSQIIWKTYSDEYAEIWQEPLDELLKQKGADYTVKIEAYSSVYADSTEVKYVDILSEMKNNGEFADIISVPGASTSVDNDESTGEYIFEYQYPYIEAVSKEIFYNLDEYFQTENGEKIIQQMNSVDLQNAKTDGSIFGLSQNIKETNAVAYNMKYIEKYDIDVDSLSADVFQNEQMLSTVYYGESGDVTAYLAYNNLYSVNLCDISISETVMYDFANSEIVNVFNNEKSDEYLAKVYDLKNKGLVSAEDCDEFFAVDTYTYTDQVYETDYTYTDTQGNEKTAEVVVIPNVNTTGTYLSPCVPATGIASWSENKDNTFEFLTLLYTDPDIANLIQYGVEGENYFLEDGKAEYADDNPLYIAGGYFTNQLITYSQENMAENKQEYMNNYYSSFDAEKIAGFFFDITPVFEEINATNAVYWEDVNKQLDSTEESLLGIESSDMAASLSEIQARLNEAGINTIIEEAERQLEEWNNEN